MSRHLLILLSCLLLLASCHESYNAIYEEVVEDDPNVESPEIIDERKVNILPTLSDPLYNIDLSAQPGESWEEGGTDESTEGRASAGTRALGGPFGPWAEDKEHWLETRFHTFGLLTSNFVGGAADYASAQKGDKRAGVLWDQSLSIVDQQGHTNFFDSNGKAVHVQYNPEEKLYRYKFFLFGTDGQDCDFQVEGNDKITTRMKIDGKHDILHSFAYHTDEQYESAVSQLPANEVTAAFLAGGQQYLYNRLSGNRGIHPIFPINHLLSRFDIYVKGGAEDLSGEYGFLNVILTDVYLKCYDDVRITVADDSWESESYTDAFTDGSLVRPLADPVFSAMTLESRPMANNREALSLRGDMDFDILASDALAISETLGVPVFPEPYHWVGGTTRTVLAKNMLMPPHPTDNGQFMVRFKYRAFYTHVGDDGKHHLGLTPTPKKPYDVWEDYDGSVLIPKVDVNGNPVIYRGGKRYSVIITVYGRSKITVDISQGLLWEEGGDIDIGDITDQQD